MDAQKYLDGHWGTGGIAHSQMIQFMEEYADIKLAKWKAKNLHKPLVIGSFMQCDGCGLQDETVKDMGWKFCPKCNNEMQISIDAVEKYRHLNPEFDGGGGA